MGLVASGFFTAEPSGNHPPTHLPHTHQESKQSSGLSAELVGDSISAGPGTAGMAQGQKCRLEEEAECGRPRWHCVRALWRGAWGCPGGGLVALAAGTKV